MNMCVREGGRGGLDTGLGVGGCRNIYVNAS